MMSPQANAGAYRLDLFCDIKFVRDIFVRWISCKNEILCHVASRTLGILFSHSYLSADQFLDLAELLLGVHEEENAIFGKVHVTERATRSGLFFGDVSDSSSSSPIDSDDEIGSSPEPADDSASESDHLLESTLESVANVNGNGALAKGETTTATAAATTNGAGAGADGNHADDDVGDDDGYEDEVDELDFSNTRVPINGKKKRFQPRLKSTNSGASAASSSSGSSRRWRVHKLPFTVEWDNRLYCAMKVLSFIVNNREVDEGCVVALDEWFSVIAVDLFIRARKAGIGVLDGFLHLIQCILSRFACSPDIMGHCKLSQVLCSSANAELLDIVTSRSSTLVERAAALELCPLLMVTSEIGTEQFAHHCLVNVLDDGRFNPFEPGDITMSRTFQRGEAGQLRTINEKNPLQKSYTVNNYIPSLLFQRMSDVFIDQFAVQRLTFLCVLKAMNILSQKIMALEEELTTSPSKGLTETKPKNGNKKTNKKGIEFSEHSENHTQCSVRIGHF